MTIPAHQSVHHSVLHNGEKPMNDCNVYSIKSVSWTCVSILALLFSTPVSSATSTTMTTNEMIIIFFIVSSGLILKPFKTYGGSHMQFQEIYFLFSQKNRSIIKKIFILCNKNIGQVDLPFLRQYLKNHCTILMIQFDPRISNN